MTELTAEQKLALRVDARERKRQQRERDKQKRIRALEAQKLAAERAERRRRKLHFFGEVTPGRNATTFEDELQIHREFLRALNQPDAHSGETLFEVAKRTYQVWVSGPCASRDPDGTLYAPAFNSTTQEFDPDFGFVLDDIPFEKLWAPPNGCGGNETIDTNSLPKLPNRRNSPPVEEDAATEPTMPHPSPATVVSTEQPNTISYTWVHPSASRYLNSR